MLSVATVTFSEKHQIFQKRLEIGIGHCTQKLVRILWRIQIC